MPWVSSVTDQAGGGPDAIGAAGIAGAADREGVLTVADSDTTAGFDSGFVSGGTSDTGGGVRSGSERRAGAANRSPKSH